VVLVGHCGVDGPRLQSEIGGALKGTDVTRVNSDADLQRACREGADLLLINREPLGFESGAGVDLIKRVRSEYPNQKMMLVSDYPDAQQEAIAAGALEGFGKRDIGSPKLVETVKQALG
jgi:DNA-binding NarL/FixJ family response regulator